MLGPRRQGAHTFAPSYFVNFFYNRGLKVKLNVCPSLPPSLHTFFILICITDAGDIPAMIHLHLSVTHFTEEYGSFIFNQKRDCTKVQIFTLLLLGSQT